MRQKPDNGLFPVLAIGLFLSIPTVGQDQTQNTLIDIDPSFLEVRLDTEPDENETKPVIKPGPVIVRDSVAHIKIIKPAPKISIPDKTQTSEDPLSFNFLYYIIEKFKMSDLVE